MKSIITQLDPTKKYICLISQNDVNSETAMMIIDTINKAKNGEITGLYVPSIDSTLRFVEITDNIMEVKYDKSQDL